MSEAETEPHLVLTGAAWKSGLRALLSIAIVVGCLLWLDSGFVSARYPPEVTRFVIWSCMLLSSFMGLFSFVRVCAPPQLVLTAEGFAVRGFRQPRLVRWKDVLKFELFEQRGTSMVGYVLKKGSDQVRDRALTQNMMPGLDGVIAVFPDETPFEVMQVLTAWRRRFGEEDGPRRSPG